MTATVHQPRWFEQHMVPDVPEGRSGSWEIKRFSVTEDQAKFLMMLPRALGGATAFAGLQHTRLTCGGSTVMTDTPDEIRDHRPIIDNAVGNVLIHGLGIGMVLNACAKKSEVEHVWCVEKAGDVLALVGAHYRNKFGKKITLVHADALTWRPPRGVRFGAVWHDIWPGICSDNLPAMKTLHRRYGKLCEWQGSWARDLCERHR